MSTNAPITFAYGTIPDGFCPATYQETFNEFAALLSGYLPGTYNTFNYGNTVPDVNDRNKPWCRLDNSGYLDRWYVFNNGSWLSPHPVPAASSERRMWVGNTTDLAVYDGGDNSPPGAASGPMWEVDSTFAARTPIGPGTLPSSAVIAVGSTGGEEKHTLLLTEMVPHKHSFQPPHNSNSDTDSGKYTTGNNADEGTIAAYDTTTVGGNASGVAEPFNVLSPYIGVYFIKRTARVFLIVT